MDEHTLQFFSPSPSFSEPDSLSSIRELSLSPDMGTSLPSESTPTAWMLQSLQKENKVTMNPHGCTRLSQPLCLRQGDEIALTWQPCWIAWSASWPLPPSPPQSCPPWGPAAPIPPGLSLGWCGPWPAGTPQCLSPSRWSRGPPSWKAWGSGNPADPWWPAGPPRFHNLCAWRIDWLWGRHHFLIKALNEYFIYGTQACISCFCLIT